MVRINVEDYYKWTTWMTYATYAEAALHAGPPARVVVSGSAQWEGLKKHTEPVLTHQEHKEFRRLTAVASAPTRREGETLVEYVSRFLEAYGVSQRTLTEEENGYSHVTREPLTETKADPNSVGTFGSFCQRVSSFVDFALNWLNEWETKELERIHPLQVPAWLEALRKRVRRDRNRALRQ